VFQTVELRWFFRGTVPPNILGWFYQQDCEPEDQLPRVDYYLRIMDGESLGIKLREGRIEVKQRYGQQEVTHFGNRAVGSVERWCKWSFELAETNGVVAEMSRYPSNWIGVKKERMLRTYRVEDDETVTQVLISECFDQECGWEVANICAQESEDEWWSLGFEAFGKETELWDNLLLVAENILTMDGAPVLGVDDSYSYPRWLQKFSN
jgi:hypothetical protein